MENTPQFKLYSDLEDELRARNAPTDRMPTVQISAMMQQRMSRQYKPVVYNEIELLRRDIRKARVRQDVSIVAWQPFMIFFVILIVYMVVLAWPEKSYVMLLLYGWLTK